MIQIILVSNDHYNLQSLMISRLFQKNAGKLFNMVLVQLMLRSHVLGLLGHLVQEVPGFALSKSYHCYEVKPLVVKVFGVLYVLRVFPRKGFGDPPSPLKNQQNSPGPVRAHRNKTTGTLFKCCKSPVLKSFVNF